MIGGHNRKAARTARMVAAYRTHSMAQLAKRFRLCLSVVHVILTREGVVKRPRGRQRTHAP